ncbi:centrosomal protein of 128 kDa isoform X4 [Heteronotia binoei]|uniref:centrosomal protein of 128 kDa isoform X4 n=1 Tax=Heteronotia binoei TaxID=13085 RepID=UPI00292EBAA4|nr:centrosomal protein of 128 kDa isoform X4 [Heteronotia binoei]
MADSSSESDTFRRRVGRRCPVRAPCSRIQNHCAENVTEKIHTLASTLQDTNRNLRHVDQMLDQYREYNSEQAEAIANLKETLQQSIGQLRSQRLLRNSGGRSASLSSLYPSDLDGGAPETRQFQPTSPLRDYSEVLGTQRRRSRSAVRFVDRAANVNQLHSLHQSLRDLSSEQIRLEEDLSRELSRRNRTEAETKRVLEELTDRLGDPQRQETVSDRVERRLQAIEREIHAERQLVERRQDQLGHMSVHLQEALKQQDAKSNDAEIILKNKLLKTEDEKSKLEQELEHSRRKLDQSEYSQKALLHQIEDLRSQLLRAEEERLSLQHQISQVTMHHQRHSDEQEDNRRKHRVADQDKQDMEKQIWELRAKLSHSAVMSEIEELKRCIERKDKEKAQLGMKIEVLTSDLEKRENQQQKMLSQLNEIQSNYKACENDCRAAEQQVAELAQQLEESVKEAERYLAEFRQSEVLRLDNEKKKEELKLKAQESIKHWKLKCKKLEHEMEKQTEFHTQLMEKNNLTELAEERNLVKAQRRQVEKMKIECDKLVEELSHKEEDNTKLRRKYQLMKQELDDKDKMINNKEDNLRRMEEEKLHLHDQLCCLQNEQESILSMIGSEIDAACEVFSRDSLEKFSAISLMPGIRNDPHRWLAETKTKLQWLCEEAKEREAKEKKLRRHLQQSREQLKHLALSKDSERQALIGQLEKQEQLLDEAHQAKKDLLQKTLRKEEEISALQDRIATLETSTQVALDHVESVPEKLSLLEDFRSFGNSPDQTEISGERHAKYKEIMGSLHQHLEDSKRRLEDFSDKKTEADISAIHGASSKWRTSTNFMSSSLLSTSGLLTKSALPLGLNAAKTNPSSVTVNEMKPRTEQEKY